MKSPSLTALSLLAGATLLSPNFVQLASGQNAPDSRKVDTRLNPNAVGRPGADGRSFDSREDPRRGGQLGGGHTLDRNLQVGSDGINPSAPRQDFYSRNLLVTDSVAGARGFRGSVGYTAADDFRGATAGDSTFRFRANAAISSPFFLALRGQDRFNMAQSLGVIEYRRDATPPPVGTPQSRDPFDQQLRLDRAAAAISGDRLDDFMNAPYPFAAGQDSSDRRVEYLASPLQGLRLRRVDDPFETAGLPTFEQARARRDAMAGEIKPADAAAPFDGMLGGPNVNARLDTKVDANVLDNQQIDRATSRSNYDDIVQKIVEHYGDNSTFNIDANARSVQKARETLNKLRERLGSRTPTQDERQSGIGLPLPGDEIDPITGERKPGRPRPSSTDTDPTRQPEAGAPGSSTQLDDDATTAGKESAATSDFIKETAGALRHGTRVTDLTTGERARVDELVKEGQGHLLTGDFFRAERCFDHALALNPDNPLLMTGLANSQIGAGLHLSAALTLRTLFAQSPEMIDTRFDSQLLPNETRLRLAIETLRGRIARQQDASSYGLTLAYLGHQMDDRTLVTEGLEVLRGTADDDLWRELLTDIWLGKSGEQKPAQPAAPKTPERP
ncbi:MAG: hypothetical protein SGJ11_06150 [Phycisphaerae bacterium]|nr:hypothetical protein [Phycisphaerae bacterium]